MENATAEGVSVDKGTFSSRFIAYIIDFIFTYIPCMIVQALVFSRIFTDISTQAIAALVLQVTVPLIYFGWFYTNKGASPGKMLMNLRISDAQGNNLSWGTTIGRESIGKFLSSICFFIGFLLVAFRKDKNALHDLMFNTQVMKVEGK